MQIQSSRGGAKPRMIIGSDLPITVGGSRKFGMYEISTKKDVIARRVELPEWLSVMVKMGKASALETVLGAKNPSIEIGESRGHIFINPPKHLFSTPAVGLDMEVYDRVVGNPSVQRVEFYVYASFYNLVGLWRISADDFIDNAKLVTTKSSFMPQMMVPLTLLTSGRIPSIH